MDYLTQILESGLMIPFAFLTAVIILGIGFLFKKDSDDEEQVSIKVGDIVSAIVVVYNFEGMWLFTKSDLNIKMLVLCVILKRSPFLPKHCQFGYR